MIIEISTEVAYDEIAELLGLVRSMVVEQSGRCDILPQLRQAQLCDRSSRERFKDASSQHRSSQFS